MKKTIQLTLVSTMSLLLCACSAVDTMKAPKKSQQPPNIVVIFADDLGYGDLSSFGASDIKTPNIDGIGRDGFISRDFFLPANVCSPSRASLLTGRYPMRNGFPVARNGRSKKHIAAKFGLHPDEVTLPEMLKPAGYRSLAVGKWHLGFFDEGSHPIDAGFDEHLGIPSNYYKVQPQDPSYEMLKNYATLYSGKEVVEKDVDLEMLTERYTDKVVDFIEQQKDEPFFVYFAHHIVHSPHKPSDEFKGSSENGIYGDFIQEMDHSTGRILATLKKLNLDDNTIVVFTSDNGANYLGNNGELNGGKYSTMEGGHIVPAMFKWPGVIPQGIDSDITIGSMDLFPLFADIAGVPLPDDRTIDGKNIIDVLSGDSKTSPHDVLYYYNGTNLQAVRQGRWKLHIPRSKADQPFWHENNAATRRHAKLDNYLLFDLENDRGERTNVASQYPDIVSALQHVTEQARMELGDVNIIGKDQRVPPMKNPQKIVRWWKKNKSKNKQKNK